MEIRNQGVFLKEKAEEGLRSRQRWMGEDRRSGLGESTKEERKSAGPEAACSFDSSRPKRSSPFSLSLFLISLLLFFSTSFYLLLSLSTSLFLYPALFFSLSLSLSLSLSIYPFICLFHLKNGLTASLSIVERRSPLVLHT